MASRDERQRAEEGGLRAKRASVNSAAVINKTSSVVLLLEP